MSLRKVGMSVAAILLLFSGWNAIAREDLACSDIQWDPTVTDRYPGIDDACYDIVERNGDVLAKVKVKVIDMSSHEIVFRFVQPSGTLSDMYQASLNPDWATAINGVRLYSGALGFGMTMDAYVPNDQWDVIYDSESGLNLAKAAGGIDPELATTSIEVRSSVAERKPMADVTSSVVVPAALGAGLFPLIFLLGVGVGTLTGVIMFFRRRLHLSQEDVVDCLP